MDTTLTDGPALKVWEISMGHSQPLDCGKFSKFVKCILWSLLTTHLPEIFAEYSSRPRKYNNTGQSQAFLALKQWWMVLVMIGVIFFFSISFIPWEIMILFISWHRTRSLNRNFPLTKFLKNSLFSILAEFVLRSIGFLFRHGI